MAAILHEIGHQPNSDVVHHQVESDDYQHQDRIRPFLKLTAQAVSR